MKKNNQGNSLVVVVVLLAALSGIVGAAIQYTQAVARQAARERANVTAQAIGDGCFDLMYACWRQICQRDTQVMPSEPYSYVDGTHSTTAPSTPYTYKYSRLTPPPTNSFNSIQLPTAAMFPNVTSFAVTRGAMTSANETISNYKIQAIEPTFKLTTTDPPLSTIPAGQRPPAAYVEDNWQQERMDRDQSWFYLASADITLPTPGGLVTTKMRRVFEKRTVKPCDYLMFFNDDLELHPASTSPFTLFGQVHTNRTLYTGTQYLTLNSVVPKLIGGETVGGMGGTMVGGPAGASGPAKTKGVSFGENWIIGWKSGDSFHSGSTSSPIVAANTPVQRVPKFEMFGWDENQWNSTDSNQNNDGPHELIEAAVSGAANLPDPLAPYVGDTWDSTQGTVITGGVHACSGYLSNQRWHSRCGIRINIDASNVVTITNQDSPPLTLTHSTLGPEDTGNVNDPQHWVYGWAHDMWKTALGVSPSTTATLNAGQILPYKKNTVASTTSGSANLTTTTAGFFAATDVGRLVHGNGIPTRTFVKTYTSGTAVVLSQNATATASGNLKIEFEGVNTITDPREAKSVDLITIDFDVFKSWDGGSAGNYFHAAPNYVYNGSMTGGDQRRNQTSDLGFSSNTWNVYVTVAQVAGKERAIRFKNCRNCMRNNPDPGNPAVPPYDGIISMWPEIYYVSDCPLYIQGDFNTRGYDPTDARGATGTQPPCNTLDATSSANRVKVWETPLPNIQWDQDSSVIIADSVTLLSNAWDDANSASALTSRIASSTAVNTRIITGDVPTNATNGYSGGGENLIRLLEDWTGKYFSFSGTLMQLYHSKIGTGTWGKANVYVEPKPDINGIGGRYFYQETAYTYAKPWGFEYMVGYFKHEWSPTP